MQRKICANSIMDTDRLWPMQAFFNEIPDEEFISIIRDMVHGIGHGFDGVVCSFPDDLDPDEEVFQGVEFFVYNTERVIVDNQTLMLCIRIASDRYAEAFPEDRSILDRILEHSELT